MYLDTAGRLLHLDAVPARLVDDAAPLAEPDWAALFDAAGLDMAAFTPVEPEWTPTAFADRRAAWTGAHAGAPQYTLRVEAAAFRGKPVTLRLVSPWTRRPGPAQPPSIGQRVNGFVSGAFPIVTLLCGTLLAYLLPGGTCFRVGVVFTLKFAA